MEGLYFEASATTPYHFIDQSELSAKCSCAQNFRLAYDIETSPYQGFNFDLGIDHLQMIGARYYLAFSTQAVAAADASSKLTPVATTGPWHIYEVAGTDLVEPLTNQPAVLTGIDPHKGWVQAAVPWYLDATAWNVPLAQDGPALWQRIKPGQQPQARPVGTTTVRNITTGDDRISFDVDRVGVPVVVKVSYFPNWKASGADGPYRITPNLMVVIPTSKHVSLHYGWTPVDIGGWAFTLLGIALVILLATRPPVRMPEPRVKRPPEEPLPYPPFGPADDVVRADDDLVGAPHFSPLPTPAT
jgi:hypothetical protein